MTKSYMHMWVDFLCFCYNSEIPVTFEIYFSLNAFAICCSMMKYLPCISHPSLFSVIKIDRRPAVEMHLIFITLLFVKIRLLSMPNWCSHAQWTSASSRAG